MHHDYPDVPPPQFPVFFNAARIPAEPGVYFLWRTPSVIAYVGQSVCIRNRVRGHPQKELEDLVSWLVFPRSELNFAEAYYIGVCRPARNFGAGYRQPPLSPTELDEHVRWLKANDLWEHECEWADDAAAEAQARNHDDNPRPHDDADDTCSTADTDPR